MITKTVLTLWTPRGSPNHTLRTARVKTGEREGVGCRGGSPTLGLISCRLLETQPFPEAHMSFDISSREVVPDSFPVTPPQQPCAPSPPCSGPGWPSCKAALRASLPSAFIALNQWEVLAGARRKGKLGALISPTSSLPGG